MPEAMQRRLVMLFCLECGGELEKLSPDEVAFALRIDDATLHATLQLFFAKGFCDENGRIINWNKRQFKSDNSTERSKKHRAKTNASSNATAMQRPCNVAATPPDTDTDTEYKKELSNDNSKKPVNQKILKPDEVSEQVWLDFLQLRKEKRAALTATALEGIRREAVKAGLSLNDALATSCRRGWQGFEAAWMREEKQKPAAHFTPRRGEPLKQNVVTL